MRPLSAPELLDVWERSQGEAAAIRPLVLLAAACQEASSAALAELSIGERDRRLLDIRELTFGPELGSIADCERCGERLEWTIVCSRLRAPSPATIAPLEVDCDGYHVDFRLPNSVDVADAARCSGTAEARQRLLERCIRGATHLGAAVAAANLPASVADAVAHQMARADPQGDAAVELSCPGCGHQWRAVFDIASFFWTEITAWAQRTLKDVHTLAMAYGWREADILALSAWRRQAYLDLIGA
jgi:hypothetical protein